MIICEIAIYPNNEHDYYTQLYYYLPTMMCIDFTGSRSYYKFKEFIIALTRSL